MVWITILLALGVMVLWSGADSRDRSEMSEEELLASYGVTWQQSDPLGYVEAAELAAARLSARAVAAPPARLSATYISTHR